MRVEINQTRLMEHFVQRMVDLGGTSDVASQEIPHFEKALEGYSSIHTCLFTHKGKLTPYAKKPL